MAGSRCCVPCHILAAAADGTRITVTAAQETTQAHSGREPEDRMLRLTPRDRPSSREARKAADMAQPSGQTMLAMVGADLGHLCALQR